jgi:hypothetical protein
LEHQNKYEETYDSIAEFKHLLFKEAWNNVYNCSNANFSLEAFLATFLHCFNIAFPFKRVNLQQRPNKKWLSKGLIVSSKRMQTLNNLKRTVTLMDEALIYIVNYQRMYKRELREAKKKGIMIGILQSQWTSQKPCGD